MFISLVLLAMAMLCVGREQRTAWCYGCRSTDSARIWMGQRLLMLALVLALTRRTTNNE